MPNQSLPSDWYFTDWGNHFFRFLDHVHQLVILEHDRSPTAGNVFVYDEVFRTAGEKNHFPVRHRAHPGYIRIIGVQNRDPGGTDRFRY